MATLRARPSLAAALLLAACSPSPSGPPPNAPAPAASGRPGFSYSPPPSAEERETLEAQIQLSRTIGVGLMVGATILRMSTNTCPTADDVVKAGLVSPDLTSRDIWGTPYRVTCTEKDTNVTSAGPDLTFDTPDDIHSSDPAR